MWVAGFIEDARLKDPLLWALMLLAAGGVAYAYAPLPVVASGDGYSAYFPAVWDLLDGRGKDAFLALEYGYFRLPGYPVLLYIATLIGGSLGRGVTVVAASSLALAVVPAYALTAKYFGRAAAGLAVVFFLVSPCVLHMASVSTPDLPCFAATAWCIFFVSRGAWAAAGWFAAAAVLLRLNAVFLLPVVLIAARRRAPLAIAGAAAPFVWWSWTSLALKGRMFWIPGAPTELPVRIYHDDFLPGHDEVFRAFSEAPLKFFARALYRGLASGPIEVAHHAAWSVSSLLAVAALIALLAAVRAKNKELVLPGAVLLASWLTIAPSHFEPRYYPLQVMAIAVAAAWTVTRARPSQAGKLAAAIAAIVLLVRSSNASDAFNLQRTNAAFIDNMQVLAELTEQLGPGCIAMEETGYRLTPLRFVLRERGTDRLCCCGPRSDQSAFLKFSKYGPFDPSRAPELTPVELPPGLTLFHLYRTKTSSVGAAG